MDSTLMPIRKYPARATAAFAAACAIFQAAAYNHVNVVSPIAPGPFNVACSNIAQDASRIAPGTTAADYWEGRNVNGADRYITDILAQPNAALRFSAAVPDVRRLYPGHAGENVDFVAIVCHPTPRSNSDASYTLPGTGDVIPHMQLAGAVPKLISLDEYGEAFHVALEGHGLTASLPLIVYSHGLTGSPISKGYVGVLVQLAAQGYMVAGVFHGDPRFSRVRVEDLSDFVYLLGNFDHVVEMELLRPLSLKTMTDVLLTSAFAPGIDRDRIGGFGGGPRGGARTMPLGARATTRPHPNFSPPPPDPPPPPLVGYRPPSRIPSLPPPSARP